MKAMILAAGRGERLRPLTDTCPKPMIKVHDKELLSWHLEKLKQAGITDVIVNSAWLSDKIVAFLSDGHAFGMHIEHSVEGPGGLETAGGIIKALPFFEGEDFLVVNGDTFIDADYSQFLKHSLEDKLGCLFLTDNPEHNPKGDFSLENNLVSYGGDFTFSGAALYSSKAFEGFKVERLALRPFFDKWIAQGQLKGEYLNGKWFDVGTIQRLDIVEKYLNNKEL